MITKLFPRVTAHCPLLTPIVNHFADEPTNTRETDFTGRGTGNERKQVRSTFLPHHSRRKVQTQIRRIIRQVSRFPWKTDHLPRRLPDQLLLGTATRPDIHAVQQARVHELQKSVSNCEENWVLYPPAQGAFDRAGRLPVRGIWKIKPRKYPLTLNYSQRRNSLLPLECTLLALHRPQHHQRQERADLQQR